MSKGKKTKTATAEKKVEMRATVSAGKVEKSPRGRKRIPQSAEFSVRCDGGAVCLRLTTDAGKEVVVRMSPDVARAAGRRFGPTAANAEKQAVAAAKKAKEKKKEKKEKKEG